MDRPWEPVHTTSDWYDGPRGGAADFDGVPHFYRSVYLDTEEWNPDEDRFELTPLTPDAFEWERESSRIFERWDAARRAGTIPDEPFGALPGELARREEMERELSAYLAAHPPTMRVRGTFNAGSTHVRWDVLDPPEA